MQYDKDMNSPVAETFLKVVEILNSTADEKLKEKQSENITSYFSKHGGICYLRVKDGKLHIGWFRGAYFEDRYGLFFGKGKNIRGQIIQKLDDSERESIEYYVKSTISYLIEHNELQKIRKSK